MISRNNVRTTLREGLLKTIFCLPGIYILYLIRNISDLDKLFMVMSRSECSADGAPRSKVTALCIRYLDCVQNAPEVGPLPFQNSPASEN